MKGVIRGSDSIPGAKIPVVDKQSLDAGSFWRTPISARTSLAGTGLSGL